MFATRSMGVLLAVALAQSQGAQLPVDGGTSTPVREPIATWPAASDGGAAQQTDEGKREALLEAIQAEREAQAARTAELLDEVRALRQRLEESAAEAEAARAEQARRAQASVDALQHLRSADAALALGSADVDDDLGAAAADLDGAGATLVTAAQQALASEDLFEARVYTDAAMDLLVANETTGGAPSLATH